MNEFFDDHARAARRDARSRSSSYGRWSGELDVRGVDLRIPASVVVTGHRDANGRYEYFSALSRDITERRAIDAARRRSETALRAIVQSSPLPIFAVDARGHRARVEPRVRGAVRLDRRRGRSARSPPFVASADEITRAHRAACSPARRSARTRRATRGATARRSTSTSRSRRCATRRDASSPRSWCVADVSDQKRAELALRESEVRFRSLVQNSSDMVTIIGDGRPGHVPQPERLAVPRFRSRRRSPTFRSTSGSSRKIGPRWPRCSSGCARSPGATETIRYRFRRSDGELRWIEMVATNHSDDPAVLRRRHERPRHHRSGRGRDDDPRVGGAAERRSSRTSPT